MICEIINDKFSWILKVDNREILFNGSDNAEYFAELYTKLGYEIVWDRDKWIIETCIHPASKIERWGNGLKCTKCGKSF